MLSKLLLRLISTLRSVQLSVDTAASRAGIDLPCMSAPFNLPAFVAQGSRLSSATVYANATLHCGTDSCRRWQITRLLDDQACVLFLVCLKETDIRLNADIIGLKASITFTEDLGLIHNIPVDNPFSLSLQDRDVVWPSSKDGHAAQRDWWLALSDAVGLGTINPADKVDISSAPPQFASIIATQLGLPANGITVTTGDRISAGWRRNNKQHRQSRLE